MMRMMFTSSVPFSTTVYSLAQVRWEWGSLRLDNDDDDDLKTSLYIMDLVQVRWEWGSLRLDAGRRRGRFNAKEV